MILTRTYYISAQTTKDPGINQITHKELGKELDRFGGSMVDCLGQWQGNADLSWLICTTDPTVEHDILILAKKYNQECVLVVYGDNQTAELLYTSGARKIIGKMVCLGPDEGQLRGRDYSYVNGKYYVVEAK